MSKLLLTATIAAIEIIGTVLFAVNFGTLDMLNALNLREQERKLGGGLTPLTGTTTISSYPTIHNDNFTVLQRDKLDIASTSIASILSLPNLGFTVATNTGVLASSTYRGSIIETSFGGTGTGSPARFRILLGSSTAPIAIATSTGSAGQVLASNGENSPPSWQSITADTAANYTWTGRHSFDLPLNASSSLLVSSRLSVGTSSPTSLATTVLAGTTTMAKLILASSTLEARGLIYTLPTSHTVPDSTIASSTLFNNGNGALSWGLAADTGASSTNPGFTGELTYSHSLGRVPTFIEIYAIRQVDNAGTAEMAHSWGMATTSALSRSISDTIRAAATIAYDNNCSGVGGCASGNSIIYMEDTSNTADLEVTLNGWTSTAFTLNWVTNTSGGANGATRIIWKIQ